MLFHSLQQPTAEPIQIQHHAGFSQAASFIGMFFADMARYKLFIQAGF